MENKEKNDKEAKHKMENKKLTINELKEDNEKLIKLVVNQNEIIEIFEKINKNHIEIHKISRKIIKLESKWKWINFILGIAWGILISQLILLIFL